MAAFTGCVAGALTDAEFRAALQAAGFDETEIRKTHRVHERAAAAIIRARKPAASGCCDPGALAKCCEPETKEDCCGTAVAVASPASCGCTPDARGASPRYLS